MKKIPAYALAFLALSLFLLCFSARAAGAITIGHVIDLSGPNSSIGRDYVAGIKTYIDAVNSQGGVNGRKIHYIARDDQGQPDLAARHAADLLERDHAEFLFGGVGDETAQAILNSPVFRRSEQILYAPLAEGSKANRRMLVWRPSYQQELEYIFSHFKKLGTKTFGIVYQESPANRQAYQSLTALARDAGMKLTGTMNLSEKSGRLGQDVASLVAGQPDFVLAIADTFGTALFLKEFRKQAPSTFVASTSLIDMTSLRELVGTRALQWTIFSQVVPDPNGVTSAVQIEHMNMMKKFRDEALSPLTLEGFAAAKTLVKIIQQSGKRTGRSPLQEFLAQDSEMDLGGILVGHSDKGGNHLSKYLELSLVKKSGGLKF